MKLHKHFAVAVSLAFVVSAFAQTEIEYYKGSTLNRAKNVMSGNLVRSTFYNYGLVGNIGEISGEWPIGTGNEYVGDVSPLVGVEFIHPSGDTLRSVATSDGPRGNPDGASVGRFWGFEPLPGFAAPPAIGEDPKVAMSNQRDTWPDYWPDKMVPDSLDRNWTYDATDPGWRGKWNGYFGKDVTNADQECYFQMDDHADEEWFRRGTLDTLSGDSTIYYYYPNPEDSSRRGLGLRVTVRGLQWSHFLAQDVIFWLYEITNVSHYTYDKVTFGMIVGTLSGGRQDSEDDLAYFDLENDITYSWDGVEGASPGWVPVSDNILVGYVGYAFLESPGNPYDGIDNDGDDTLGTAPILSGLNFVPVTLDTGDAAILIDYDSYERIDTTVPGSQITLMNEPFENFPLEGWEVQENGADGVGWQALLGSTPDCNAPGPHSGNNAVWHDDEEVGMQADWLISPPVAVPSNAAHTVLTFWERNCYVPDSLDSLDYHVLFYNNGDGWDAMAVYDQPRDEWTEVIVNADFLAGDTVRFAWVYHGDSATEWFIDDVTLVAALPGGGIDWTIRGRTFHFGPGQILVEDGRNNIDDNLNGLIDERPEDHTGLRYINYFTGAGLSDLMIDEARDDGIDNDGDWSALTDDVGADGVALTGDAGEADGEPTNGEPHFDKTDVDESDQIGLNAFEYFSPPGAVRMNNDQAIWDRMAPGHFDIVSQEPEDGDFIYGSGYFPLRPGQTERFSMALAYGEDFNDLEDNKITVQQIYNENYNFARPPEKPTLWAVPGDGRVTLYWDDVAESSFDPVTGFDFEGYKIYRSTDPGFNEVFTITDALGRKVFHKPIAQFDLDNGNAGMFPVIRNAVIYYLGNDTGLEHAWTDTTVENGQTYYYALVAYDRGDVEKEILPAENSKTIVVDEAGNVTLDINTIVIVPRAPAAGYTPPEISIVQHLSGSATGAVAAEVLDPSLVRNHMRYEFRFSTVDTGEVPINYSLIRHDPAGNDTVLIANEPLIPQDNLIGQAERFGAYYDSLFNLPPGTYQPGQYFRVAGTNIYDGQRAYILVLRDTTSIPELTHWADTSRGLLNFEFDQGYINALQWTGKKVPGQYQIEWYPDVVDTSIAINYPGFFVLEARSVNFRVRNAVTDEYIDFAFEDSTVMDGQVQQNEVIYFLEMVDGVRDLTWTVEFFASPFTGDTLPPSAGDVLYLATHVPYSDADRFEYSTGSAGVNAQNVDLAKIRVYPNPYVAANPQEPTNPFNEGRGERRITFTHLPDRCTIRIYNVRGDLVDKIEHATTIDNGNENWDMRSKDGLNVAYGVYLYHVDSPYGETTGRFAVIK